VRVRSEVKEQGPIMFDAGGGFSASIGAAVAGIAQGAANFASAAADGSFAVSETGGQALLQAIREMRDWINGQGDRLVALEQEPPLGGSYGAQAVKPYSRDVATDQQGFIAMLKAFGDSLDQAEQGIRDAMKNYRTMDTELAQPYNNTVEA
jgi:hypothetical protein